MEEFLQNLSELNPLWVYVTVAAIAYIENILPPFPSDVAVVAAGALIAVGRVDFLTLLIVTTAGSTLGFMTMYKIGDWIGDHILEAGKIKFIPVESVRRVEEWFRRYGYGVIVANRFLAGTRAVVSFFAGLSELSLWKTTVLSFVSALIWNSLLLFAGKTLGDNWSIIIVYLEAYSKVVTTIVILGILVLIGRYFYLKKNSRKGT